MDLMFRENKRRESSSGRREERKERKERKEREKRELEISFCK
jgi:hypothetical protein